MELKSDNENPTEKKLVWSKFSQQEILIPLPQIPSHRQKDQEVKCKNPYPSPKLREQKSDIATRVITFTKNKKEILNTIKRLNTKTRKWNQKFN